jgi:hypothetical protein
MTSIRPKVIVVNDTSPGGHIGCALVMQRLSDGLTAAGCEVTARLPLLTLNRRTLSRALSDCDLVVVNGEGTLHHDGRGAMLIVEAVKQAAAAQRKVALVNSVWQENKQASKMAPMLLQAYVREARSAALLSRFGAPVSVVPDLLLSSPAACALGQVAPTRGTLAVLDHVNPSTATFLARFAAQQGARFHSLAPRPPLRSLRTLLGYCRFMVAAGFPERLHLDQLDQTLEAEIIVTGRFHGACLAIAAGRPFVAVASNTHKTEGLLEDAGIGEGAVIVGESGSSELSYSLASAVADLREIAGDAQRLARYREACDRYVSRAVTESDRMFEALGRLASGA